MEERG